MTYKIAVSKAGYNVLTEANSDNLVFSSDFNTLKYATSGNTTVVIHQSSLTPDTYNVTYYNAWSEFAEDPNNGVNGVVSCGRNEGEYHRQGATRFTTLYIPQGTTITDATLYCYVNSKGGGSGNLKMVVYGIDEDNTSDFSGGSPMGRGSTDAHTHIDQTVPGTGNWITVNVSAIITEIIGRNGWTSGNALAIKVYDEGSPEAVYWRDPNVDSHLDITYANYAPLEQEDVILTHNLGYVPFFTAFMKEMSLERYYNLPYTFADAGIYIRWFLYATTTQLILRTEWSGNDGDFNFTIWYKIFKNNTGL